MEKKAREAGIGEIRDNGQRFETLENKDQKGDLYWGQNWDFRKIKKWAGNSFT